MVGDKSWFSGRVGQNLLCRGQDVQTKGYESEAGDLLINSLHCRIQKSKRTTLSRQSPTHFMIKFVQF